jgi:hypothetical protein
MGTVADMTSGQWLLVGIGAALVILGGPDLLREHWRGPVRSLDALLRLADGSAG